MARGAEARAAMVAGADLWLAEAAVPDNRNTGTADENKAIVQGSIAHFGTYTVADKVITLKVEGGTWPAWTGTDQKRPIISLTGDDIKWSVAASIGGTTEVGWKRVK